MTESLQTLVSIIIPHWNNYSVLHECLESLTNTINPSVEIIVVDNASEDGSPENIKQNFPNVSLIQNQTNDGFAGGCNLGSKSANGSYLLFLNNDTTHESNWIEPLIDCLKCDNLRGVVQPKILNFYQPNLFDYAGGAGGHMDILGFPFAKGRIFLEQENDSNQYDKSEPIFWASGTAMMIKKNVFEEAGKFDGTFFAHMEEIDLCWRVQKLGYEIWSEPKSIVYHKNAVSLPMYSLKKYYLNHRNSLYMLISNFSIPLTFYLFPLRLGLEIIALFYSLSKLDWKHMTAILMGLIWLLFHPHYIFRKRRNNKAIKSVSDRFIIKKMFKGSIVVAYYLLRKKTYSEISTKAES